MCSSKRKQVLKKGMLTWTNVGKTSRSSTTSSSTEPRGIVTGLEAMLSGQRTNIGMWAELSYGYLWWISEVSWKLGG